MAIEPRNPFETADDGVTELQEKVLLLLEAADMSETVCDRIMAIIATAEADKIDGHGPFTTDELE